MKFAFALVSLIILLLITGCASELTNLEKNICTQDSDCWSTDGGCFTPEWFAIEDAKTSKIGINNKRPTSAPDIICTCEQNKCIQQIE